MRGPCENQVIGESLAVMEHQPGEQVPEVRECGMGGGTATVVGDHVLTREAETRNASGEPVKHQDGRSGTLRA